MGREHQGSRSTRRPFRFHRLIDRSMKHADSKQQSALQVAVCGSNQHLASPNTYIESSGVSAHPASSPVVHRPASAPNHHRFQQYFTSHFHKLVPGFYCCGVACLCNRLESDLILPPRSQGANSSGAFPFPRDPETLGEHSFALCW